MKAVRIIVCCHKRDVMARQEPYMPVHVGSILSDKDLSIQSDAEGDNISSKNPNYCELTGMYWAWKNLKGVDVIGLCHYRRYFDFHNQCDRVLPETIFPSDQFDNIDLSIPSKAMDLLCDGSAYVARPRFYRSSLYLDYCQSHVSDDIRILENYIMTTQPEDIRKAWFETMHCSCQLRHYNMFIMTWHNFDAYCTWLFPLLSEMERRIDVSRYNPMQGRVFGYMAERLLNVWLMAKRFRLHERPVIWFNDGLNKVTRGHLKYFTNLSRSRIALSITRGNYNSFRKQWQ